MSAPFKTLLVVDFETRFSRRPTSWSPTPYSLSSMTTEAYIRSPLFKAFGMCIHEFGTDKPIQWYSHDELPRILSTYDWRTTAVAAQNAQFDAGILSFIYDVHPCFIIDTLSMARAVRGVEAGNGLAKLADAYGLPAKGHALNSTDGLLHLPADVEAELVPYCQHDVWLCEEVLKRLLVGFPKSELRLIDMTLRMFTEPVLELDVTMLRKAKVEDELRLVTALDKACISQEELASNPRFAEVLKGLGVSPPMKTSKATGKQTLALAKSDSHFQALLTCGNEDVEALCEARLRVKSTAERTRAQRFIDIAENGALPVPLKYYGADTGRWGGDGSINLQSMKRGSFLRKSIMAPEGDVIVIGDLSQIEPRVLAWLAGYEAMLAIFRAGGDPYATFGAQMFVVPGLSKETHPLLRQSAKSALLGAGYMLGWASFAEQLLVGFLGAPPVRYNKTDAKQLGVTAAQVTKFVENKFHMERMVDIAHVCTDEELLIHCLAAKAIIEKYRNTAEPVVAFWKFLGERLIRSLIGGEEYNYKDVLLFRKEEIVMVNGMSLKYPNIEEVKDERGRVEFTCGIGSKREKLYAGRLANNVTQGLARVIMTEAMLRVNTVSPVVLTVHDEFGVIAPEENGSQWRNWLHAQMVQPPKWMPDLPLNADVGFNRRYGLAKG